MTTSTANATADKKAKSNAAPATGDNAKAKSKGGNDGVTPRALRGAPKPTAEWSAAQEEAFAKLQAQREQARAQRAQGLGRVLDLLLADIPLTVLKEAVAGQPAGEVDGKMIDAIEPQEEVAELLASREELLANIEKHGNAILTHLSTFFKLDPVLAKQVEGSK